MIKFIDDFNKEIYVNSKNIATVQEYREEFLPYNPTQSLKTGKTIIIFDGAYSIRVNEPIKQVLAKLKSTNQHVTEVLFNRNETNSS